MQTQLRWNRMDEHYAMELVWSRLELVRILGKIKRPFNFIRNKSLKTEIETKVRTSHSIEMVSILF